MKDFRKLGKDIVAYGLMGGLSRSLNFLLLPILTHQFSTDEYGIINIVATLTSFLALLMALTLESAVARMWFESGDNGSQKQLVSSILIFIFIFGISLFIIIWHQSTAIANLILGNPLLNVYIVLGCLSALLTALLNIPYIVLRMERRIVHYNILLFIHTLSYVLIALLLIFQFNQGLFGVFIAQTCATSLALVVGLVWISTYLCFNFSLQHLKLSLHYSIPMFPAVAVTWLNKQVDRIILLTFIGLSEVGVFSAAANIALVISLLVSIFQQAWAPFAISFVNHESKKRNDFYRKALNYYSGLMVIIALILVCFSKEVLAIFAPANYQSGYVVIPWLIGAQILHGSGSITNIGMLISKKTFGNSIAAWTGAVINVGLGLLLIPRIGIEGAAIGSFLAELTFTGLLWYFSLRVTNIRFDRGKIFGILGIYCVACASFLGIYNFCHNPIQSLIARLLLLILSIYLTIRFTLNLHKKN